MKHMNYKLQRLLHEGFSINTIEKLSDSQLSALYNRVFEQSTGTLNIPKTDTAAIAKAKSEKKPFVTYEEELEEDDFALNRMSGNDPYETGDNYSGPGSDDGFGDEYDGMSIEGELEEKAVSRQQQKIMGLALSVKKGDTPKSKVSKKVQNMAKEMSKKDLEDFASTKHKGLPKRVEEDEVKKLEESILSIVQKHIPTHFTKGEFLRNFRSRI
jgi:hypothetical protein